MKANGVAGHSKTSFLIEDILTTKSSQQSVVASQFAPQDPAAFKIDVSLSNESTQECAGRVFTAAAALLGTRAAAAAQGHGSSLLTSSTVALRQLQAAAAFYASSVPSTPAPYETTCSASLNNGYLFHSSDNVPGFCMHISFFIKLNLLISFEK